MCGARNIGYIPKAIAEQAAARITFVATTRQSKTAATPINCHLNAIILSPQQPWV